MLGLPGTRNTSSDVRVIRQGTELSSGLRAFSDKCSRVSRGKKMVRRVKRKIVKVIEVMPVVGI